MSYQLHRSFDKQICKHDFDEKIYKTTNVSDLIYRCEGALNTYNFTEDLFAHSESGCSYQTDKIFHRITFTPHGNRFRCYLEKYGVVNKKVPVQFVPTIDVGEVIVHEHYTEPSTTTTSSITHFVFDERTPINANTRLFIKFIVNENDENTLYQRLLLQKNTKNDKKYCTRLAKLLARV